MEDETKAEETNGNEKEAFVDMIMDLLIIINLDGVSEDEVKERRMRAELLKVSDEELGDKYNQAVGLLEEQRKLEAVEKVIGEVADIGVEAVRQKYGIN